MADNENHPPEKQKPEKKLLLDLSEAMAQGFEDDDEDDIIELKDEVSTLPQENGVDIDPNTKAVEESAQSGLPAVEKLINLDELDDETGEPQNVIPLTDDLTFEEEGEDDATAEFVPLAEEDEDDDTAEFVPLTEEGDDDTAEFALLEEEDEDDDSAEFVPLTEEGDDDTAEFALLEEEDEDDDSAEIMPIEEEPVLKADGHDEVEEITEFDDILSDDPNEMMTLSEIGEEIEPEDEFLELIDVEEDSEDKLAEIEDDIIQFKGPNADIEDVELKDFINDSVDEEIQIDDDFEDDLASTLGVEAGPEINMAEEKSTEEEFDFNMDSSEISEKTDQLETIFFDEMAAESELDENAAGDAEAIEALDSDTDDRRFESETEGLGADRSDLSDVPLAAGGMAALGDSPDEIERTIEGIIERKFSGKIESMITRIIEKAVSVEIKRLKSKLLEDDRDEIF